MAAADDNFVYYYFPLWAHLNAKNQVRFHFFLCKNEQDWKQQETIILNSV